MPVAYYLLGAAPFETAGIHFHLHGAGQLFGPARFEEAGAEGLGVGGGASRGESDGFGGREVAVQEAGEKASEVGVAATHRRDGFHLRGARRDGSVLGAQVGEPFRGGNAGVGGPELDEPGDAQGKVTLLDEVEACYALGLVL